MATEVLRPQDCLIRSQRRMNRPNKAVVKSDQSVLKSIPMTILRRGKEKKVRNHLGDVYAGSAFLSTSPPPASSLPFPSFSNRKVDVDDSATRDLRRLLRLE